MTVAEQASSAAARRRLVIASVAVLVAAADTYVVVPVLPSIMNDVGVGLERLQEATPIVSGFLLGYVAMLPLLGRLSDVHGRRPVFVACLVAFAAGSLLTAAAQGLPMVVAGRTVQGLGGGGLVPVTLAMVADGWPVGRRGVPLGVVGAVQELGSVLGPLYGAVIVEHSTWRTIFWINLPLSFVLVAAFVAVRDRSAQRSDVGLGRRDVVGPLLFLLAAGLGALAVVEPAALASDETWGQLYAPLVSGAALTTPIAVATFVALLLGIAWEAASPFATRAALPVRRMPALLRSADWIGAVVLGGTLACIIVAFAAADPARQVIASAGAVVLPLGAVLALLFVLRERRAHDPLVPLAAVSDRAAYGSLLVNLALGAALMAALVDVPIFARSTAYPDSQVSAALVLVRFLAAVPVGALLGGLVTERLSHRVTCGFGMALSAAMFLLMSHWGASVLSQSLWGTRITQSDAVLAACGLGFGLAIAPVNAAILGAVRGSLHGLASALVVVARMIGMLVGLSVLTATGLRSFYAASAHIPSPLKLCPKSPANCPAYDTLARAAVLDEMHAIFLGAAVCAAIAAALSLALLRRHPGERARAPLSLALGAGG